MDFTWTEERVERLKNGMASGMSARELGAEFEISRNAVLGKCYRLKISVLRRQPTITPLRRAKRKPPGLTALQVRHRRTMTVVPLPELKRQHVEPLRIGIVDLEQHHCRWPLDERGTDGLALFCGNDQFPGRSYCPCHSRFAFAQYQQLKEVA